MDHAGLQARFHSPYDLAQLHDGQILVVDRGNQALRVVEPHKQAVSAVLVGSSRDSAASGCARLTDPSVLCVCLDGSVMIVDGACTILQLSADLSKLSAVGGVLNQTGMVDGRAIEARFCRIEGLVQHPAGFLVVADAGNHCLRKLEKIGLEWWVSTIAGSAAGFADGNQQTALFNAPSGLLCLPDGVILVADTGNYCIRRVTLVSAEVQVNTVAGIPKVPGALVGGHTLPNTLNAPRWLFMDQRGTVYISSDGIFAVF